MKFGLSDYTIDQLRSVFRKHPEIDSVIVYGSRAKGNYREGSDIDLTLVGDDLTHEIRSKICMELDDLNTPYLMDVSVFHQLESKDLMDHINRVGKEFYKKEN